MCHICSKMFGYLSREPKFSVLLQRSSTLFTRLCLTRRHVWAGNSTTSSLLSQLVLQSGSSVSPQDILNGDDLYPAEAAYWMTTDQSSAIHQPHCPALRDRVPLHVRYHKGYEYECPTHTAEELHQLTTTACRLEIRSPRDFKFFDNIITKKADDHMERYAAARKSLKSRLWSLFWVTYIYVHRYTLASFQSFAHSFLTVQNFIPNAT